MEIGLTIKSAPYNDNKNYIQTTDVVSVYVITMNGFYRCPAHHHLAYIDLLYNLSSKEMTVRFAHAPTSESINVLFLTQTTLVRFSNVSLYPLLSYRASLDVSVHAID